MNRPKEGGFATVNYVLGSVTLLTFYLGLRIQIDKIESGFKSSKT